MPKNKPSELSNRLSASLEETNRSYSRLKALSEKVKNAQKHMEELQGYMYDGPAPPSKSFKGHTDPTSSKDLTREENESSEKK